MLRIEVPPMPPGAEAFEAYFDEETAAAACAWFPENLVLTEGEFAGQPFELAQWEFETVRHVFGWKRADGTRLVRVVYLEVAKKNGKTEFAAGLALLMLVADGEMSGQVYAIATNRDQAAIVFDKATTMVLMSPTLKDYVNCYKTSLFCEALFSSFKPLSGVPTGKHGFSVSAAIGDEVHEWVSDALKDVVHKNTAARRQPLEIYITNAGLKGEGPGWEMHQQGLQRLSGEVIDPEWYVGIWAADDDDDWTDEAVWAKANPNLGISPKIEFMRSECKRAQELPRLENDFRRFHLSQWVEQTIRWIPMAKWRRCTRDADNPDLWRDLETEMHGRRCYGGLDMASTNDIASLALCFPPEEPGDKFTVLWRNWVPANSAKERSRRDKVKYVEWIRTGALIALPGDVIDHRPIQEQILADAESFLIEELALDRWNTSQIRVELEEDGLTVFNHGQGFGGMAGPCKEVERLFLGGGLEHGNHPVATWAARNTAVTSDPAGNIKPDKRASSEKIDPMVAKIMAVGRACLAAGPQEIERGAIAI